MYLSLRMTLESDVSRTKPFLFPRGAMLSLTTIMPPSARQRSSLRIKSTNPSSSK